MVPVNAEPNLTNAIILFTKVPKAGLVKTRLASSWPGFSEEDACRLYECLLEDTLTSIMAVQKKIDLTLFVSYTPEEQGHLLSDFLKSKYPGARLIPQAGKTVTERVVNAFTKVFDAGYEAVTLVPGDHDDLDSYLLEEALVALEEKAVVREPMSVLGPTCDGGAYLLGLNKYTSLDVIGDLRDTYRVCLNIILRVRAKNVPYLILDERMDLDDQDDVLRVLNRKERLRTRTEAFLTAHQPPKSKSICNTSIVVPTFNEEKVIRSALLSIRRGPSLEVILVDGGSRDRTLEEASGFADKAVVLRRPSRRHQENVGAVGARGEVILFLHADMRLPFNAVQQVRVALSDPEVLAGSFRLAYDNRGVRYVFLEHLRRNLGRLFMVHGIGAAFCVKRQAFYQLGGFEEHVMEEGVELSRRLRGLGRLANIDGVVFTSARRFEKKGFLRTLVIWGLTVLLTTVGAKGTWIESKLWGVLR